MCLVGVGVPHAACPAQSIWIRGWPVFLNTESIMDNVTRWDARDVKDGDRSQ